MSDVTRILSHIEAGDPAAAEKLLPLVYDELRKLAAIRLAREKPGQTLQATALIHEAYVRLVGGENSQPWDGRGHFFAAAAEAMRRILVDSARRKQSLKAGGHYSRVDLDDAHLALDPEPHKLLALDDALTEARPRRRRRRRLIATHGGPLHGQPHAALERLCMMHGSFSRTEKSTLTRGAAYV